MREVSEQYLDKALKGNEFKSTNIIKNLRTNSTIESKNILSNSFAITSKCVNNNTLEFGAVYQAEFNVTLLDNPDVKANDVIECYQVTETDTIQLGTYIVQSALKGALTYVKAFDGMDRLNKEIESAMSGLSFDVITAICTLCGIELGMTEAEFYAMPNTQFGLSFNLGDGSYRDVISKFGRCLGVFAIMVNGKLMFKEFSQEVQRNIPKEKVMSFQVETYLTEYKGIYARFLAVENYYPYSYNDGEKKVGLITNLDDINIYTADEDVKNEIIENVYNTKLKNIAYYPNTFSLTYPDASIELGDLIEVEAMDGSKYLHHVMSYTYKGNQVLELQCLGDNPASIEATESQIQESIGQIEDKSGITILSYTNAELIDTSATDYTVGRFSITQTKSNLASLHLMLPITVLADTTVIINFMNNGVKFSEPILIDLEVGNRFVNLSNYVMVEAMKLTDIEIFMTCELNTLTIQPLQVRTTLITSAISTSVKSWNGILEFEEKVSNIDLSMAEIKALPIQDNILIETQVPKPFKPTENVPFTTFIGITIE